MDANGQAESVFRQQPAPGISILKGLGIIDFNGYFSVRLDDGRILINTGNSVRSAIGPEDFVVVGPKGELSEDAHRPSCRSIWLVYQVRPDVRVVIHGHAL
jgi:L-fuculose-phosphate aldolase